MPDLDLTSSRWRKSSRSSGSGNCVEVALADTVVGLRDSKDRTGPVLAIAPTAWTSFMTSMRSGDFDLR